MQPNGVKHLHKTQQQTKERATAVPFVGDSFDMAGVVTSVFVVDAAKHVFSFVMMGVVGGAGVDGVDTYSVLCDGVVISATACKNGITQHV